MTRWERSRSLFIPALFSRGGQDDGGTEFDGAVSFVLADGGVDLVFNFRPGFGGNLVQKREQWRGDGSFLLPGFLGWPGPGDGASFFLGMGFG